MTADQGVHVTRSGLRTYGVKPNRVWAEWVEYGGEGDRTFYSGGFLHEGGRLTNECDHMHKRVSTALRCATDRLNRMLRAGSPL